MRRFVVILALLVAATLAGCTGQEAPQPPADGGEGTTSVTPVPAANASVAPVAAPPAPVDVAFAASGRTWTTACVVAPPAVGQCQHLAEGSALTEPLPGGEPVVRFRGTLTWEDGNEVVGIGVVAGEGDDVTMVEGAYAEGTSPLAFDFDLSAAANATLGFHVASYANVDAGAANVGVSPGQDWTLEGTLTVLRPA